MRDKPKSAIVLKVRPEQQLVVALPCVITPQTIRKLCKSNEVRAITYGNWQGYPVNLVAAVVPVTEEAGLPRWQLFGWAAISGEAILFGMNKNQKAASCPIPRETVLAGITWLPPLAELGLKG